MTSWQHLPLGRHQVPVPAVMGIVNATPDSFSDGGLAQRPADAVAHAHALVQRGAHLLDLGAESTRPGALEITPAEEWQRLEPVLLALLQSGPQVPITIDTRRPEIAARALTLGAHGINDVGAGADADMAALAARHDVPWVAMHGYPAQPATGPAPHRADAATLAAIFDSLLARARAAEARGLARHHIWLDPGLGFGKDATTSLAALEGLGSLAAQEFPVLVGPSRKRFLGGAGSQPTGRDEATAFACCIAAARGAAVFRVHAPAAAGPGIAFGHRCHRSAPRPLPSSLPV